MKLKTKETGHEEKTWCVGKSVPQKCPLIVILDCVVPLWLDVYLQCMRQSPGPDLVNCAWGNWCLHVESVGAPKGEFKVIIEKEI